MQRTFESVRWAPKGIVKSKGNEPAARTGIMRSNDSEIMLIKLLLVVHSHHGP
jgi:hypothetical protein